jgi:DHA1 family multidrug resistance protein-like MFS transporter
LQAHHGYVGEEEKNDENDESNSSGNDSENRQQNTERGSDRLRSSSDTRVGSQERQTNDISGAQVDPEKGRDVSVVTWFGENDPEVSAIDLTR